MFTRPHRVFLFSACQPHHKRSPASVQMGICQHEPSPGPPPAARAYARGIVHSAHKGPRVRWQTKTPQAALRRSGSGWGIASAVIRALPHSPRRAACGFFACLNKSEKGRSRNPLILLSHERRNFDIERKLLTFARKFLLLFLRSCVKLPSPERRKSVFIFT